MKIQRVKIELEFLIEGMFKPSQRDDLQDDNILAHLGSYNHYAEIVGYKVKRLKNVKKAKPNG